MPDTAPFPSSTAAPSHRGRARGAAVGLVVALALAGCASAVEEPSVAAASSPGPRPTAPTTEAAPTSDGPGATLGPDCTVGTIPPGRSEPWCDRLYSPFVAPGQDCTEGQAPDCIDPDGDGRYTWVDGGGRCLVERHDPERCLDADGDGALDVPLDG